MRVLIIVPVYNERKYVVSVLDRIMHFHPDLLAVDDGSSDGTCQLLTCRSDLHHNDPNRHFGGNLDDAGERLGQYLEVLDAECRRADLK